LGLWRHCGRCDHRPWLKWWRWQWFLREESERRWISLVNEPRSDISPKGLSVEFLGEGQTVHLNSLALRNCVIFHMAFHKC
jgi:hypothetical protein